MTIVLVDTISSFTTGSNPFRARRQDSCCQAAQHPSQRLHPDWSPHRRLSIHVAGLWRHSALKREILTVGGYVWPEPRVTVKEKLRPALHEQRLFALPTAQLFLVGLFPAARGELVVVQLGIGRKDGTVARLPHAQAKIRIVKADGEFLVVAADLLKYIASHHLAGTRYGAKVARPHGARKKALTLREWYLCCGKLKHAML